MKCIWGQFDPNGTQWMEIFLVILGLNRRQPINKTRTNNGDQNINKKGNFSRFFLYPPALTVQTRMMQSHTPAHARPQSRHTHPIGSARTLRATYIGPISERETRELSELDHHEYKRVMTMKKTPYLRN